MDRILKEYKAPDLFAMDSKEWLGHHACVVGGWQSIPGNQAPDGMQQEEKRQPLGSPALGLCGS